MLAVWCVRAANRSMLLLLLIFTAPTCLAPTCLPLPPSLPAAYEFEEEKAGEEGDADLAKVEQLKALMGECARPAPCLPACLPWFPLAPASGSLRPRTPHC